MQIEGREGRRDAFYDLSLPFALPSPVQSQGFSALPSVASHSCWLQGNVTRDFFGSLQQPTVGDAPPKQTRSESSALSLPFPGCACFCFLASSPLFLFSVRFCPKEPPTAMVSQTLPTQTLSPTISSSLNNDASSLKIADNDDNVSGWLVNRATFESIVCSSIELQSLSLCLCPSLLSGSSDPRTLSSSLQKLA